MTDMVDLDELSAQQLLKRLQVAAAECFPRDRDQFIAACPLIPNNLTGSYFRAPDPQDPNAEAAWTAGDHSCKTIEGLVVGDPMVTSMAVIYLVEFFGENGAGQNGALGYQQLVDIDRMLQQAWLFYDDRGWLSSSAQPLHAEPSKGKTAVKREHAKDPEKP